MTTVAESAPGRTDGVIGVMVPPEPNVSPPSPFEQFFNTIVQELEAIFAQPTQPELYEPPLGMLSRQDILLLAMQEVVKEWGPDDKNKVSGALFRNGDEEDLVAILDVKERRIRISLKGGLESAKERLETIVGPLTSHSIQIEDDIDTKMSLGPLLLRQQRERDFQGVLESRQPGFRPRPARVFEVYEKHS